ncbi:Hypothetical predicted protein, partial [Mytilus galloprovincialis]
LNDKRQVKDMKHGNCGNIICVKFAHPCLRLTQIDDMPALKFGMVSKKIPIEVKEADFSSKRGEQRAESPLTLSGSARNVNEQNKDIDNSPMMNEMENLDQEMDMF